MTNNPHFIIVDDDPINNFITKRVITKIYAQADVIAFTEPEAGLEYVLSMFAKADEGKAILLLDINMPSMTGWQFMEQLQNEITTINERLIIYILSSSVSPADKESARVNPYIKDYLIKSLTPEAVISMLEYPR